MSASIGMAPINLAICYRIYPRVSGRPIFGFRDKLSLVQLSLRTFKAALGALKPKICFLLDQCPDEYESFIRGLFVDHTIEIIRLAGEGNGATFGRQVAWLSRQTEAELVYFAEDDYLYLPGAFEAGVSLFRHHPAVDFATLYYHPDYDSLAFHKIEAPPLRAGTTAWYPVAATCLTFMARHKILLEKAALFQTYTRGNSDLGLWLALTKRSVRNPLAAIRSFRDGKFVGFSHLLAWRFAAMEILFGRSQNL